MSCHLFYSSGFSEIFTVLYHLQCGVPVEWLRLVYRPLLERFRTQVSAFRLALLTKFSRYFSQSLVRNLEILSQTPSRTLPSTPSSMHRLVMIEIFDNV
jgi:hypothetical protein